MATVLNVKIDPELKRQAQATAKRLGLPLSTVVAAGLREFVRTRSITISEPPRLRPEVEEELLQMSRRARSDVGLSPAFGDLDSAFEWLGEPDDAPEEPATTEPSSSSRR